MTSTRSFGFAIAFITFALDQGVKALITGPVDLPGRGTIDILPIFRFIWVNNPGVSMGLLTYDGWVGQSLLAIIHTVSLGRIASDQNTWRWLLVALTAAISVGVLVWMWRERRRQDVFGLGMILGGALGNILDRVRFGHVIDFANLHFGEKFQPFLVFNLADAAITIGVMILFFRALLSRDSTKAKSNA